VDRVIVGGSSEGSGGPFTIEEDCPRRSQTSYRREAGSLLEMRAQWVTVGTDAAPGYEKIEKKLAQSVAEVKPRPAMRRVHVSWRHLVNETN